ncbi:MAG: HAD hydrolase-like protein [Pirellulales bacterium]|nr:HAD hydrolase-like protein [Pirellulales bacterium]
MSADPLIPICSGRAAGAADAAPLPQGVRGVLFDMCNVLYDDTVWRRWVLQLLTHMGLHTNYRCFFRVWDREYLDDVHRGARDFCDAFGSFLRSSGLSRGQIDEVQAACQGRRRHLEANARPLPGVKTTLGRLHAAGFVLGVISNSLYPASVLTERLGRFAAGKLFSTVVSSIDLKRTMPDAVCYHAALKAMNLSAGQVAFVGHDPAELAGAAAVGMATIAFNYDPDARADVYLARFDELPEMIPAARPVAAAG